jgi:DNA-binding response OmpR family regulator
MRILLVEDEDRIASFILKGLTAEGHLLERVASGSEALEPAFSGRHDLILLDLKLPDGDGREIVRRLRASRVQTPVLVLSAVGEIDDKVDLLDLGANDYLTKPFAFRELAARVRALTRPDPAHPDVLEAAGLTLDARTRLVTRGQRRYHLSAREFTLLEYLMRHAGETLERAEILEAVWGTSSYTESNVVDVYVRYLRRKLDEPESPSVIETVRGVGYRVPR